MSRTYREVTIERVYDELAELRCDLCGARGKHGSWERGIYEVNETEVEVVVRQKDGDSYPEGGSGMEYIVDLCPECFVKRLVPWLISEGADIKPAEWDW